MLSSATRGSSPHTRGAPRTQPETKTGWEDHPRIRGEHLPPGRPPAAVDGIIPAYAGSTAATENMGSMDVGSSPHTRGAQLGLNRVHAVAEDHPRIRGEHQSGQRGGLLLARIIPAYAGSTTIIIGFMLMTKGSSPHTRGAPPWTGRSTSR